MAPHPTRRIVLVWCALVAFALFRLGFGLASSFWTEDERQVYLIGLQAFTRHAWPYFGADVVWSQSRLPGALQGLLVAGPLYVLRIPEAPFLLLNLLSFGTLAFFAWYLSRRLPQLPCWFVWTWLMTVPWTMHFSTHIVNTSYVLPGAIVFFVGFFEAVPALSIGALSRLRAWALMGLGLAWTMQIHMSWVLMPAYLAVAGFYAARAGFKALRTSLVGFIAGAAVPASLLIPTLLRAGIRATGGTERNLHFQLQSVWTGVTILARFLAFASFEANRFLGLDEAQRLMLLVEHEWLAPLAVVVLALAIVQPVVLLLTGFRRRHDLADWSAVRFLTAATVVWIYGSYFFSIKEPLAHAFYVTFPVATLYAMYCWTIYAPRRWFRATAATALAVNALFLAGYAIAEAPDRSLYRARDLVVRAIAIKDDRLLGERRDAAGAAGTLAPAEPLPSAMFLRASATDDLHLEQVRWSTAAAGRVSQFDITIRNAGTYAAYIDLEYHTQYFDAGGAAIREGRGVLKYILQPGEVHRWEHLTDGMADSQSVSATLGLLGAEKVVPRH